MIAYWQWQITNDPYLTDAAKKDLNTELALNSWWEFPPVKVFRNLYNFWGTFWKLRKAHKVANNIIIEQKIIDQMPQRGWNALGIKNTIRSNKRTVKTKDTRYNSDGTRRNDSATAYILEDWNYVVVNDKDYTIVQISNKLNPNWKSPF